MLFGRRKELEAKHQRELQGENLWTRVLDEEARWKIAYAVERVEEEAYGLDPIAQARKQTLKELGRPFMVGPPPNTIFPMTDYTRKDAYNAILQSNEDIVFTFLEALFKQMYNIKDFKKQFIENLNIIFSEHWIKFNIVNDEIRDLESLVIHENIIKPILTLLGNNPKWKKVESKYMESLKELSEGRADNAITDATTALQEALGVLSCKGNTLNTLFEDAKKKGIFVEHDKRLIDWLSADRVNFGDAHYSREPNMENARLTINIVGSIIYRIASGKPRKLSSDS